MAIHCTMDELLAMRDGEASAAVRQHLESCEVCRQELDLLHQRVAALKALPTFRTPRDRWPIIREALRRRRRRGRWMTTGWIALAAAASLTLWLSTRGVMPGRTPPVAGLTVQDLVAESQALEGMLRALDPTSRVLNGRAASAIAELEDRVALLDAQLSEAQSRGVEPETIRELWQQRVQLMDALVDMHVTRAAYVGL